jgi:hypothetical protein
LRWTGKAKLHMEYHGTPGNDLIDQKQQNLPAGTPMFGGAGDDTIVVSDGQGIGGAGNDTIVAASDWASVAYWDSPAAVNVDLGKGTADDGFGTVDKLVGIHVVQGSPFDDRLVGGDADEYFYGGNGNNTVIGGGGFDTVDYFFEPSTNAEVSYDAATDTFTVAKHFKNGDTGIDKLSGVEAIAFVGAGAGDTTILRSQYVGDFRTGFQGTPVSAPPGAGMSQFKGGDFNGDGIPDFVFVTQVGTGTAPAPTYILLGDGQGGFRDASATVFGVTPMNVVGGGRTIVADFNNDGVSDIFQLDFGNDAPPFAGGENHLYLSAPTTGQLGDASAGLSQRPDLNHGGSAGDVNGDGFTDVLVDTLDKGNILLLNDGTGNFHEANNALPNPVLTIGGSTYLESSTFSGIVDVNGDGAPDLILGTWDGNAPHTPSKILLNDGHGNFTHDAPIALPSSGIDKEVVLEVEAIDLNGDAYPDLMLSVTNGGAHDVFYHTDYIELLVNDGTGHFRDETAARLPQDKDTSSPGWLTSLSSVDFNHDGFADILAESAGDPVTSKVYLNRGDGSFALDWETPAGEHAQAADVDGDGMQDIVSTYANGKITTSLNKLANGHVYVANFGGDQLLGSSGADVFYARPGRDVFDGAGGFDRAVFAGARADYTVTAAGSAFQLVSTSGVAILENVERVQFSDTSLAFDVAGAAGQAYRVYQAAFGRVPDLGGLGFWIGAMGNGATLLDVSRMFLDSPEFGDRYGKNQDDPAFIATLYHNVLHREPDADGLAFWENYMAHGGARAELLAQFSESQENQLQVIGSTQSGIDYIPYH